MREHRYTIPVLLFTLLLFGSSCRREQSVPNPKPVTTHPFAKVKQCVEEYEVFAILGPPDDIRTLDGIHLLDGTRLEGETYRWAYGIRSPATFARIGVVSFGKFRQVLHHSSPTYKTHYASEIRPLQCVSSSNGLSCVVSNVTMTEAGDETVRIFSARITIRNDGTANYKENLCSDSLHILSTIEIYDSDNTLIFQDDHRGLSSSFGTPYILEVRSGDAKTGQVNFIPGKYFGDLSPGRYSLRICLPLFKSSFIGSDMLSFTVPEFPKESVYWKRFPGKILDAYK